MQKNTVIVSLFLSVALIGTIIVPIGVAMGAALGAIKGTMTAIDGDTLRYKGRDIRLFGIDAFEFRQMCGRFACGKAAQQKLAGLIRGKTLRCQIMDYDHYSRPIGRCLTDQGIDLSSEMARAGLAVAYRRYSFDYVDEEQDAKAKKAGAWCCRFISPLNYRKSH